tara:strand:+ start:114 stop:491 length:378 start_codon:yes stop_codon:yes gene_type:complete
MKHDLNYIANLEKAIKEKYGAETIANPKADWSEDKEKEYLKQLKSLDSRRSNKSTERTEINGVSIIRNLIISEEETPRECSKCSEYSFCVKDDAYMLKYDCCFKCYVMYIEGRSESTIKKEINND